LFLSSIGAFAAGKQEADDEEKAREMEKALFMAAGAQDRVLKIGLVDCIAYALKNKFRDTYQAHRAEDKRKRRKYRPGGI